MRLVRPRSERRSKFIPSPRSGTRSSGLVDQEREAETVRYCRGSSDNYPHGNLCMKAIAATPPVGLSFISGCSERKPRTMPMSCCGVMPGVKHGHSKALLLSALDAWVRAIIPSARPSMYAPHATSSEKGILSAVDGKTAAEHTWSKIRAFSPIWVKLAV